MQALCMRVHDNVDTQQPCQRCVEAAKATACPHTVSPGSLAPLHKDQMVAKLRLDRLARKFSHLQLTLSSAH